jgi:hypothetical protein
MMAGRGVLQLNMGFESFLTFTNFTFVKDEGKGNSCGTTVCYGTSLSQAEDLFRRQ